MAGKRWTGTEWLDIVIRRRRYSSASFTKLRGWRWDGMDWIPLFNTPGGGGGIETLELVFNLDEAKAPVGGFAFNLSKEKQL